MFFLCGGWEARELCRSRNPVISEMLGGRGWATTSQCAGHCKKKLSPEMMMNLEYGLGQLIGKTQIYKFAYIRVGKKNGAFKMTPHLVCLMICTIVQMK